MNTDTNAQSHPTKQPLGEGNILVWRNDAGEALLHHTNGLTIALNRQERQDSLVWLLKEQEGER